MDDDYVNKQIVCPTCNSREILYIDLNDIREDPRANAGTVTRSFIHNDHLLLLDIDHQGDIRTINQIDKKQRIEINESKYQKITEFGKNSETILLISSDMHLELLLQHDIDKLSVDRHFTLVDRKSFTSLKIENRIHFWLKNDQFDKIPDKINWDTIFIENEASINNPKLIELFQQTKMIITSSSTIFDTLCKNYSEIQIELI